MQLFYRCALGAATKGYFTSSIWSKKSAIAGTITHCFRKMHSGELTLYP